MIPYGHDHTCPHGEPPHDCEHCPPPVDLWEGMETIDGAVIELRPGTTPTPAADAAAMYADIAALLAGGLPEPEQPTILRRDDGHALFYPAKVNVLFGDPESGKTWVALAAVLDTLANGGTALFLDLDHNGAPSLVQRLLYLGGVPAYLADPARFRIAEPEDQYGLLAVVADTPTWNPTLVVVDSIGELMPLMGASSNSPDEWTTVNRRILTKLSAAGAAVVCIDHLPKSPETRTFGQTGTTGKKRSTNGASYRVTLRDVFAPGRGGACGLDVEKDRPGGVRGHCPPTDNGKQRAGLFVLTHEHPDVGRWRIAAPVRFDPDDDQAVSDVDALDTLNPPPTSYRDVRQRMRWGARRAEEALREWRNRPQPAPDQNV